MCQLIVLDDGSETGTTRPDGRVVLVGADDEIRTRDPHLGKVMLYQLSHVRRSAHPTNGG